MGFSLYGWSGSVPPSQQIEPQEALRREREGLQRQARSVMQNEVTHEEDMSVKFDDVEQQEARFDFAPRWWGLS